MEASSQSQTAPYARVRSNPLYDAALGSQAAKPIAQAAQFEFGPTYRHMRVPRELAMVTGTVRLGVPSVERFALKGWSKASLLPA